MRVETEKERRQRLARERQTKQENAYRSMFQPGKHVRVRRFISHEKKITLPSGIVTKAWTEDDMPFLRGKTGIVCETLKLRNYGLVVKVEMNDTLPPQFRSRIITFRRCDLIVEAQND